MRWMALSADARPTIAFGPPSMRPRTNCAEEDCDVIESRATKPPRQFRLSRHLAPSRRNVLLGVATSAGALIVGTRIDFAQAPATAAAAQDADAA